MTQATLNKHSVQNERKENNSDLLMSADISIHPLAPGLYTPRHPSLDRAKVFSPVMQLGKLPWPFVHSQLTFGTWNLKSAKAPCAFQPELEKYFDPTRMKHGKFGLDSD